MSVEVDEFPGREITVQGKKFLYFGGTGYLGLQKDEAFIQLFIDALRKYGSNYGASRKANIRLSIFEKVEHYLANLVGSDACLSMSSGFLAGQFLAQTLSKDNEACFYAPNTHSALYTSQQKTKSYVTFSSLNIALRHYIEDAKNKTPIVFLDAIDFSGANYPYFEGLKKLPLTKIILVVDDSHGIGIVGENGSGIYKTIKKLKPKEVIVCCSLGKGFGIQAGAIFGTKERLENLKNTEFFGGASPATPASLVTLVEAEHLYHLKRTLLTQNIAVFLHHLKNSSKFQCMKGHPAFSFSDENLTKHLEENAIIVTSFRYPTEEANLMSRIVITAAHTEGDILRLCEVINRY